MELPRALTNLLNLATRLETREINITKPISNSSVILSYNGRAIKAQVVGSVNIGKATLLIQGLNYYVYQNVSQDTTQSKLISSETYNSTYKPRNFSSESTLFIILSVPIPLNYTLREQYTTLTKQQIETIKQKPYMQFVEDIVIKGSFASVSKSSLIKSRNADDVKNIFELFYKFLKGEKKDPNSSGSQFKSFYNYLKDERIRDENITKSSLILESQEQKELKRKIKVFTGVFPNNTLLKQPFDIKMGYLSNSNTFPFKPLEEGEEERQFTSSFNPFVLKDEVISFRSDYLEKDIYLNVLSNLMLATKPLPIVSTPN